MKLTIINQWKYRSLLPVLSFIPMLSALALLYVNGNLKKDVLYNKKKIDSLKTENQYLQRKLIFLSGTKNSDHTIHVTGIHKNEDLVKN